MHFWDPSTPKKVLKKSCLRTEVRSDFNIHGTKYFLDAVFHQKSKKYDVVSLLFLWWAKKTGKYRHSWLLLKMPSKGVFNNNQPCQYFMESTGFLAHQRNRRLTTSYFFQFLMEKSILQIFGFLNVKIIPSVLKRLSKTCKTTVLKNFTS